MLLRRAVAVAALLALAGFAAAGEPETYRLDPVHTRVMFAIDHAGFSKAIGTVSGSTGTLVFDPEDWRSAQRAINEELASAQEEIGRLEAAMHPRDRSEFQRLMEKKGGLAIVLVAGGSCTACHVKVRPAALQALKAGREIVYCDSCKRILYWDMQRS